MTHIDLWHHLVYLRLVAVLDELVLARLSLQTEL
jgi:hypothetical protein